jgi:hypothetical protein
LIVDPEPLDSTSDSDDGVPEIIRVSFDSDVEEFVEFEPMMEVELEIDIAVREKLILKIPRPISRSRGLKAIMMITVMPLVVMR